MVPRELKAVLRSALLLLFFAMRATAADPQYIDIAPQAGIDFHHRNGARGDKHLPETMGSGVAFLDYDADGHRDTNFFLETNTLYHNEGDGYFRDLTAALGPATPSLSFLAWRTAFLAYDNDGNLDLFVANGRMDDNV